MQDQAGEVPHKDEAHHQREGDRAEPLSLDLVKQEQIATTSRKHSAESHSIWGLSVLALMPTMEAAILKVATALVALLVGSAPGTFAQRLSSQAATIQKQDRAQREVRLPSSDLFASTRPSPAEIHRCAAGHRLNAISRSACKLR
jgi:hypothetical protein